MLVLIEMRSVVKDYDADFKDLRAHGVVLGVQLRFEVVDTRPRFALGVAHEGSGLLPGRLEQLIELALGFEKTTELAFRVRGVALVAGFPVTRRVQSPAWNLPDAGRGVAWLNGFRRRTDA